jgi:hypothetical protein
VCVNIREREREREMTLELVIHLMFINVMKKKKKDKLWAQSQNPIESVEIKTKSVPLTCIYFIGYFSGLMQTLQ